MDNDTVETPDPLWGCAYFPRQNIPAIFRQSLLTFPVQRSLPTVDDPYEICHKNLRLFQTRVAYHDGIPDSGFFTHRGHNIMQTAATVLHRPPLPGATPETGIKYPPLRRRDSKQTPRGGDFRKRDGKWYYYNDDETPVYRLAHPPSTKRITSARTPSRQQAALLFDGNFTLFRQW